MKSIKSNDKQGLPISSLSIKCYILSPDRKMRSPELLSSLEQLKIPFEIIDNSSITHLHQYLQSDSTLNMKSLAFKTSHKISEAQLACTFGHYLMHNALSKSGYEWGIFLENDATIDINLMGQLLGSLEKLPRGIVLLGACGGWARKNPVFIAKSMAFHTILNSAITGSHAYLVHSSLISEMTYFEKDLISLPDEFIRGKLKMYITIPYVSFQSGLFPSSIPLVSPTSRTSLYRIILSSCYLDLNDICLLGRYGNRVLRLKTFERIISRFFMKLPGCNYFYSSQIGSNNDQL
jgi:hypothetical protein